ncbi:hypothetical protein LTR85_000402 [Meristemomyces frigidus]|nr:hypothetical protein LTR85_000402 [Meristemomyces frigidus]
MAESGRSVYQRLLESQEAIRRGPFRDHIIKRSQGPEADADPLLCYKTPKDIPIFDPPGDCDVDTCNACKYQYWSKENQAHLDAYAYEHAPTDEEATATLSELVGSIRENREWLRAKLETYGDNFLKRWKTKYTQPRRKAVIEQVKNLEPKKWPQLTRLYARDNGWIDKRPHRNAFLVPHLNVESLAEEKLRVLSLLSSRVQYSPDEFFRMDRDLMEMGLTDPILERDFNANCVSTTEASYGQLCAWDKELMHCGECVGYPVAKLVLEAQCITMHALRTIVEAVLSTVQDGAGDTEWRKQEQEGFQPTISQLGARVLESPYGPPPSFDAEQVLDDVYMTLDSYEDELSALQCDPAYVQLRIRGIRGGKGFNALSADKRWAWMSFFIYAWGWFAAIAWTELAIACHSMLTAVDENGTTHDEEADISLPPWYIDRLQELENALSSAWIARAEALHCLLSFKGFEDYCEFYSGQKDALLGGGAVKAEYLGYSGRRNLFTNDPLFWVVLELARTELTAPRWLNRGVLLGFLSDVMRATKSRKRIDHDVEEALLDLGSLWLIWRALRLHRPSYERQKPDLDVFIAQAGSTERSLAVTFTLDRRSWNTRNWSETGALLKAFNEASWPNGKQDLRWLSRAGEARTRLRAFWDRWRVHWRYLATNGGEDPEAWGSHAYPEHRFLKFDLDEPSYQEEWSALEARIKASDAADRKRKASTQLPEYATPKNATGSKADVSAQPQKKKTKQKTRPAEPVSEPETAEPEPVPSPVSPERPPIFVKRASLDVFSRMWPDQSGNIKEGTIRWDNVLSAMTDAGCATWQNDGSKANFSWEGWGGGPGQKRRIQFHKPHGDGDTADASMLTSMGYRLTRRFGWKWKHLVERPRAGSGN